MTEEYGKRTSGGAKLQPPISVDEAKAKIAEQCGKMLAFHEALQLADTESDEKCGVADLPEGLRRQLRRTMTQVKKLVNACNGDE